MQLLYATHFQISPRPDETTTAAFDRISNQIRNWTAEWYARHGHQVTITHTDQLIQPLPGHSLSIRTQGPLADGTIQTLLNWIHGDSREAEIYWHVNASISMTQGIVEVAMTVSRAAGSFRLPPKSLLLGRPRIVRDLLVAERCSISNFPIGITPLLIKEAEIADFVENLLCSSNRTLPVLLISPNSDSSFQADPGDLADKLAGLCTVVALGTQAATHKLTYLVGRELSCFNGAARLYWPGLSPKSNPWQHPLFLPAAIERYEQARARFHGEIIANISAALSLRALQGSVTRQASVAFAKARRDEIEDIKHRYEKGLTDYKEFEGVLRLVEEERDAYKEELEKAKNRADLLLGELEAKTLELEEVKKNWRVYEDFERGALESAGLSSDEEELVFSSVEDAVAIARDQFGDNIEILDSAIESAADCPFQNPCQVYKTLQAVNEVADIWKKSLETKTSMGGGLVDAFRLKGIDFKKEISQTCRTKFEKDYTFSYGGKKLIFEQHITGGSGNPNSCFSVHMLFDKDVKKVIVAHVGKHLPNTST
jgi:hypothetical protein